MPDTNHSTAAIMHSGTYVPVLGSSYHPWSRRPSLHDGCSRMVCISLFIFLLVTLSPLSHAFFCPNNFSQIEMGDTIDKVTATCGKPDKEVTKDMEPVVPQEWSYYIPQTVASDTMEQQSGTLKTSVTFDKDGKAINISVNGLGVGSSTICGAPIQLGSTMDQIKAACGEPSFVNKQQPATSSAPTQPKSKQTQFMYGTSTLIFTDGVLTGRN